MSDILLCLKKYGERLDSELADEMGLSRAAVRHGLAALAASGAVVTCNVTRFKDGTPVEGWLCRVSGYVPRAAPGRKPNTAT